MPTRNHFDRVRTAPEGRVPQRDSGRDYQESDEPASGYSGVANRMGAFVERNTAATVLTSFGIGFGLGLFVTLIVTQRESGWYERYLPESMQDLPETFKHLPERLKQVPESLASYMPSSWKRW